MSAVGTAIAALSLCVFVLSLATTTSAGPVPGAPTASVPPSLIRSFFPSRWTTAGPGDMAVHMLAEDTAAVPRHLLPNLGNGYSASQFESDWVFVSGVFVGEGVDSHRAPIPSPVLFQLGPGDGCLTPVAMALDWKRGAVERLWLGASMGTPEVDYVGDPCDELNRRLVASRDAATEELPLFSVLERVYHHRAAAHRHQQVLELHVNNSRSDHDTWLDVMDLWDPGAGKRSGGVVFDSARTEDHPRHSGSPIRGALPSVVRCVGGRVDAAESPHAPAVDIALCRTPPSGMPYEVPAGSTATFTFVSSIWTSVDPDRPTTDLWGGVGLADVQAAAKRDLFLALEMVDHDPLDDGSGLFPSHVAAMDALWGPRIEVDGDARLAQVLASSLYNVMISLRSEGGTRQSSSPGGLSNDCYRGHVFWDMEAYVLPFLTSFHPDAARDVLRYRHDRAAAGVRRALQHEPCAAAGFPTEPLRVPWESAVTGEEVSPWAASGDHEIHVSGDVAVAAFHEFLISKDLDFVRETSYPLAAAIATWFVCRAEEGDDGRLHLNDVMGVDEGVNHVNDNAFTNAVAKLSCQYAAEMATYVTEDNPMVARWRDLEARLDIPFDAERGIHLAYAGFNPDDPVGTGLGVVFLGYPLRLDTALQPDVLERNLDFYANTQGNANAMVWGLFSIGYKALGGRRDDDAAAFLARSYENNVFGPFHIWTEFAGGGGCPNFITGAGLFLQTMYAGYAGVRVFGNRLELRNPSPPGSAASLRLKQLWFMGHRLDIEVTRSVVSVECLTCDFLTPYWQKRSPLMMLFAGVRYLDAAGNEVSNVPEQSLAPNHVWTCDVPQAVRADGGSFVVHVAHSKSLERHEVFGRGV